MTQIFRPSGGGGGSVAAYGRLKGTSQAIGIPMSDFVSATTRAMANNTAYYGFFWTPVAITIDQMLVEVTAFSAGTHVRLGIYNADVDFQPTTLVVDAGVIDCGSNGVKTASINTPLPAGRYVTVVVADGAPTLRVYRMSSPIGGIQPTMGATPVMALVSLTLTYGALAGTGTAWTTHIANNAPFEHHCFVRIASIP